MNPAQVIIEKARSKQDAMNAVIDRGDSPIQLFYSGATVFVTGGSGFLGKQLIEKLFRSCDVKKLYVLLRSKKEKNIEDRLKNILKDPLYDLLRQKKPGFEDRIVPLQGDVAFIRLGLNQKDWLAITEEVDFIFHLAATVRFDMPIKDASIINIRGTREVLFLAKQCGKLKNLIHVSTAFTHASENRVNTEVLEQFYPCPMDPNLLIDMVETMDEQILVNITNELKKGWPNTYTFTKALAEELVRTTAGELPVCIVRPPIVLPCYYEPSPGWLDLTALQGPSGIVFGIGMGVLHTFFIDTNANLPMTPLDYVNNATIAAGWDSAEQKKAGTNDIHIYTVSNKDSYLKWSFIGNIMRNELRTVVSPRTVWYGFMIETHNNLVYWILSMLLHYIPAYIADALLAITGKKLKEIPSFIGVYNKAEKFIKIFSYFLQNEWYYRDYNVQDMLKRMSDADKAIFNCDLTSVDFKEYVTVWYMGLRQFVLKDGLVGSEVGIRNQNIFKALSYLILFGFLYTMWCISSVIVNSIMSFF